MTFAHADIDGQQYYRFYPSYQAAVDAVGNEILLTIPAGESIIVDNRDEKFKVLSFGNPESDFFHAWTIVKPSIPLTQKWLLHTWNDQHRHFFAFFKTREDTETAQFYTPNSLHSEIIPCQNIGQEKGRQPPTT